MKNKLLLFIFIIFSFAFNAGFAQATTYYVAKNGLNSNPGTEAHPWLTIQKAANNMVAGDTTYVKSGTYNEQVLIYEGYNAHSGSAGAWITLKAFPGDHVIIDGTGKSLSHSGLVYLIGNADLVTPISYWDIEDFEIVNSSSAGVEIYRASNHLILKNLTIHNCADSGIMFYNSTIKGTNMTVDGCEIYNTNSSGDQEALSMQGVNNFEIKNCKVHDTSTLSPFGYKEGIDLKNGCSNGIVHNNEVYGVNTGIYVDTYATGTDNILIYNNYIHNSGVGIDVGSETGDDVSNISIYNNIALNCSARAIGIQMVNDRNKMATFKNINIYNNTVYANTSQGYIEISSGNYGAVNGGVLAGCHIVNNIVDSHLVTVPHYSVTAHMEGLSSAELIMDHNLVYSNSNDWAYVWGFNANNYIGNSLIVNPQFVDPTNYDFRLKNNSPAIDVGSSALVPNTDYSGSSRPSGASYDVGAYEFIVASDTTAPARSNSQPSGSLSAGTTQTTISLATDESATCRYSTSAGTAYASMTGTFTTTGATTHSRTVTGLANGSNDIYYVRCIDSSSNANTDDFTISFSISSPSCVDCGLGNPVITPTSPMSGASFTLTCPANAAGYDCVDAYANGSSNQCTFASYSGNNAIFGCTGLTTGSYTSRCVSKTGTSRNCCASEKTISYTVQVPPDTTAPSQITGLSASNITQNSLVLTWTAPGDDGSTGKATSYDVRYSTASITSFNWTSATAASGEPTPLVSGTSQTLTVSGLTANTTYYFAIRATDDSGNVSVLSNIAFGKTLSTPDTTPSVRSGSQPTDTLSAGTTQTTISLTTNESATCKYSTAAGTAYTSMTGTFTTTGGTTHSKTITGLTNGSSYTYYVRCIDAANNANTNDFTISFSVPSPSCIDYGLGAPVIAPTGPLSSQTFTMTCPANASGYDCIDAYANGSSNKCTFSSYSGNNAVYNCTGLTAGTYTSRCEAKTGTSRNCCANVKTGSYIITDPVVPPVTPPPTTGGGGGGESTGGGGESTTTSTSASNIAQLQALIQQLFAQVAQLQAQLALQQGTSQFRFLNPLYLGLANNDVKQLQVFLISQGPAIYPEAKITGYYGLLTRKAVIRFQLKYNIIVSETSLGAGLVGIKTRAKINEIVGK